ncbi:MAG: hypothetical protein IKY94_05205 [Lachnospiraceae bacterium]|nr:hypothetical protein [Lachnospiraceae bacterium]
MNLQTTENFKALPEVVKNWLDEQRAEGNYSLANKKGLMLVEVYEYIGVLVEDIKKQARESYASLYLPGETLPCDYIDIINKSNLPERVANFYKATSETYGNSFRYIDELFRMFNEKDIASLCMFDNGKFKGMPITSYICSSNYHYITKEIDKGFDKLRELYREEIKEDNNRNGVAVSWVFDNNNLGNIYWIRYAREISRRKENRRHMPL